MPAFRALYYPSWNPPVKWLRSMLLFFDQIQVIRPRDVGDPRYHEANKAVFDLIPEAFKEIKKRQYQMNLVPKTARLLSSALDTISSRVVGRTNQEFDIRISRDGSVSVPGYAFVHVSKLEPWLLDELELRSLILNAPSRILRSLCTTSEFRLVQREAGDLILAMLADHYGQRQRLRTITDKSLPYLVNTFNVEPSGRAQAAANLASVIIRMEIPDNIAAMKPKEYVALRKRYDDLREPFQHAVQLLCDDYQLAEIIDKEQFKTAVNDATKEFRTGTIKLRKLWRRKRAIEWGSVGLAIVSSFCPLVSGVAAIAGPGISAALHVYRSLRGTEYTTEKRRAQQLLGELKGELAHPILLRRIALS